MIGIIGGGITGLTAAYALKQEGLDVQVLEAGERAGGVIRSERIDGFLVEHGPQSVMAKNPRVTYLIHNLGLDGERLDASAAARKRFIVKNGELAALPSSPASLFTDKVFSLRGKGRILLEPFIRGRAANGTDESVASFVERRLGREVLDYAVNPFVSGIFAGDPAELSIRHAFPALYELERQHGSLLKGQIRKRRSGPRPPRAKGGGLLSFREGLATLPAALEKALGGSVSLSSRVKEIRRCHNGWSVAWEQNGCEKRAEFEQVLITIPAYRIPELGIIGTDTSEVGLLRDLPYSPLSVMALGFERTAVGHPLDGFGFLVPEIENLPILGVAFSSSTYSNRAPENHVLLSLYIGGARQPELAREPTEELLKLTLPVLEKLLGVRRPQVFTKHVFSPRAIPQYNLGYDRFLSAMTSLEKDDSGLLLAGNYRGGISLGECIQSGFDAAERVQASLAKT